MERLSPTEAKQQHVQQKERVIMVRLNCGWSFDRSTYLKFKQAAVASAQSAFLFRALTLRMTSAERSLHYSS